MEGFKAGSGLEAVLQNILYGLIKQLSCLSWLFLSVIFDLTVSDWIVNSFPCTFNFHLKRIPVLYEVEFSDVY